MKTKVKYFFALVFFLCINIIPVFAQDDTARITWRIKLDSVVISEVKNGFNINDFIALVQNDTTFYAAFQNLHKVNYNSLCNVRMFDKNYLTQASYDNISKQTVIAQCRWMKVVTQNYTGGFFDANNEMHYYTAKLFAYIFLYADTICNDSADDNTGDSQLEKRKDELKTLIFNPGKPVSGIPLMGNKMAIFDEKMMKKYDYAISSQKYSGNIDCYVFSVKKKTDVNTNDVVIKEMNTWFDKKTLRIVARDYALSYSTIPYDFDVTMQVKLIQKNNLLIPGYISYTGNWNAPGKKRERGTVVLSIN